MLRRRLTAVTAAASATFAFAYPAAAEAPEKFPSKPVMLIVPWQV